MKILSVKEHSEIDGWIVNDKYHVPNDEGNRHAKAVLEYISEGGRVSPADPPPPQLTIEEEFEALPPIFKAALEAYMDLNKRPKAAVLANIKRKLKR